MGMAAILVMVNNQYSFPCTQTNYMHNLVENDLVVSEKNKFDFSYVNNPGLMSTNDLDHE